MKVRFWEFQNDDWVKLTLKPGQVLEHYHCERHEEGYSYEHVTWELSEDGKTLFRESNSGGQDCDGRMSYSNECEASTNKDTWVDCYDFEGEVRPDWNRVKSGQRDYSAEAMGY